MYVHICINVHIYIMYIRLIILLVFCIYYYIILHYKFSPPFNATAITEQSCTWMPMSQGPRVTSSALATTQAENFGS